MSSRADMAFGAIVAQLAWIAEGKYKHSELVLRAALDIYIDARIAEKVPQAVPCPDLEQAKRVDRSIVGPTAREVHEAWRKWSDAYVRHVLRCKLGEKTGDVPNCPAFPELET